MDRSDAFELQHSALNGFLFADIGVEAGGMELSVLSALARVDLDPWQEAARLATLPWTAAVEELARVIATMPASLWPLPVARVVATRLVALLPGRGRGPSAAAQQNDVIGLRRGRAGPDPAMGKKWLPVILLGLAVAVASAIGMARLSPGTGTETPLGAPRAAAEAPAVLGAPPPPPGDD